MFFIIRLDAAQDLHRVLNRRLIHVDLLEAAHQGPVLLEVASIFLVGRRSDATQLAAGQRRLEQVGRIHRAAGCRTGADDRVDLVDEEHRALHSLDFIDNGLQPFLKVTAIASAGEKRAHIEGKDLGIRENLWHFTIDDALGQPFSNGGFAHAGITHIKRIVLGAAGENLDRAFDFVLASDQRVDVAVFGLLVEMHAIGCEGLLALFDDGFTILALFVRAVHGAVVIMARHFGNAMGNVVDRVEAGHLLLLQEVDRMALTLREYSDQHVPPGDFLASGGLHMDRRALQNALETSGRFGFLDPAGDQARQFLVDILRQVAAQMIDIDSAGPQDRKRILVFSQRQEQVLEGRIFVMAFIGDRQCAVQGLFQVLRQHKRTLPFASGLRHPVRQLGHSSLIFLESTLQWVFIFTGIIHDLGHFGLCHFIGKDTANADALLMDMEHNLDSFIM